MGIHVDNVDVGWLIEKLEKRLNELRSLRKQLDLLHQVKDDLLLAAD